MIHFRTQHFEGPLELLLSLVEEKELAITEISLSSVTEQYLAYVRDHRNEITLEHLAGFLSVAARLLLLKSKALLPFLVLQKEEEEDVADLATQLAAYKQCAAAATALGALWQRGRQSFVRLVPPRKQQIVFTPPEGIDAQRLAILFEGVLGEIPTIAQLDQKRLHDVIALEERMMSLARSLQARGRMAFSAFLAHARDKSEVIVSFLALLELIKQNIISAEQHEDEIVLEKIPNNTTSTASGAIAPNMVH